MRPVVRAAYTLTLLTGAAGLIYQVAWQRYMARLVGSDSLATAAVLGVFLGGLSLGYLCWGRLSERTRNLLVAYGLIETGIGLWGLCFPWLYLAVDGATSGWGLASAPVHALQAALLTAVLTGPPTLLMGGTVPLLTRGLTRSLDEATGIQARLYAWNTAGAALGALGAGFVLIRALGLSTTLRVAALLNLAAAAYFLFVGRREGALLGASSTAKPRKVRAEAGEPLAWPLYAIAFLGGFAFMTLEALVVRVGGLSIGASSYTLSLVLTAFLVSIAIGAWLVARRRSISQTALAVNQLAACAGLLVLFLTLDKWPWGAHLLRIRFGVTSGDFVWYHLSALALLVFLLLWPVGCMGATLPLTFDALKRGLSRVGRDAGAVLAWSALGNLLGGLIGGYAAFRFLEIGGVALLAAALVALSAVLAARGLTIGHRIAAGVALALVALFAATSPAHDPTRFAVGTFRVREPLAYSHEGPRAFYDRYYGGREILAYRDDPQATFAVVENPRLLDALRERFPNLSRSIVSNPQAAGEEGPPPRAILINGKADSSTFYDRETLKLAAHLPALLSERRDRVLVIGLGTGVTAGQLALYPDVRSIEVAEIATGVVELLPWFGEATGEIQDDPRLTLRIGDAFRLLRGGGEPWDLVASQPSNPWTSGVDQLYSLEFVTAVRARLAEGGVFVQWVQRYSTTEAITAIVVNTLREVFPHVRVFRAGSDDLLVASISPIDAQRFERAARLLRTNAAVRSSLAAIDVEGIGDLLARERPEVLQRADQLAEAGLETLDRPRIHFLAGLSFFRGDEPDTLALQGGTR